ncbi:uncharacterized protein LOC106716903 [Papilio machaon]|uniref:uncharacterized protein LOC106716903 n=1 Tax=Papilio machaon TaxID=76193 RepID=UPI001E663311|nr:uncharacterized protein LOC106716903 [Papilio machaon]
MAMSYLWIILIFVICAQALHSFKELYCQDPDTKMLHAVNTTWAAKSFCGNYTCKLRKKNRTNTELVTPLTKINITNININFVKDDDMSPSASDKVKTTVDPLKPSLTRLLSRERVIPKTKGDDEKRSDDSSKENYGDRYLTDSEIKTITDMLHTVKKSDLEAIVEIYNLAQDIYKDIEKNQEETFFQDTMTPIHAHGFNDNQQGITSDKQRVSYWYEPLNFHNSKVKPEVSVNEPTTTTMPTTTIQPNKIKIAENSNIADNPYFKESLTDKDVRKLPYYYPMSTFQRVSSYTHTLKPKTGIEPVSNPEIKVCKKLPPLQPPSTTNNYLLPSWINKSLKKSYFAVTPQNVFEPSLLLPFPFAYVNNNNITAYPPSYYYDNYNGYPWAHLNIYNRNRNFHQSYLGTAYIARVPGESLYVKPNVNSDYEAQRGTITRDDIIDIISSLKDKEMKKMPDWQTNSLPKKVIDEVKGNAEKSKMLKPLRKKVRIERIGKVIKLDESSRSKRSINNEDPFDGIDEYETYITTTTCQPSTEIGFFRRGNMSRSFPECCPERIQS